MSGIAMKSGNAVTVTNSSVVVGTAKAVIHDFSLNFSSTISHEAEVFFPEVPSSIPCILHQMLCAAYCPWETYRGEQGRQINVYNKCIALPCGDCADWKIDIDDQYMGRTSRPGVCDNGICYCCCKTCTCDGHAVLARFHDADGEEFASVHKTLFTCWACVDPCNTFFGCLLLPIADCYHILSGHNVIRVRENVYGPFSGIETGEKDKIIGHMEMVDQLVPITACCAKRTPLRYTVSLNDKTSSNHSHKLAVMGLLPLLYKGLAIGSQCCVEKPVNRPAGCFCMDYDRDVETEYMTLEEYMNGRS